MKSGLIGKKDFILDTFNAKNNANNNAKNQQIKSKLKNKELPSAGKRAKL